MAGQRENIISEKREDPRISTLRESYEGLDTVLRKRWDEVSVRLGLLEEREVKSPALNQRIEHERLRLSGLQAEQRDLERAFTKVATKLVAEPGVTLPQALKQELGVTLEAVRKRTAAEYKLLERERHHTELTRQYVSGGDMGRDTLELILAVLPIEEVAVRVGGPVLSVAKGRFHAVGLPEPIKVGVAKLSEGVGKKLDEIKSWVSETSLHNDPLPVPVGGGAGRRFEVEMPKRPELVYSLGAGRTPRWGEKEVRELLTSAVPNGERSSPLFSAAEVERLVANFERNATDWSYLGYKLKDSLPVGTPAEMAQQLSRRLGEGAKRLGISPDEFKEIIIQNPRTIGVVDQLPSNLAEGAERLGVNIAQYIKIGQKNPSLYEWNGIGVGRAIGEFLDAGGKVSFAPAGRRSEAAQAVMEFLRDRPELIGKAENFANRGEHVRVAAGLVRGGELLPFDRSDLVTPLVEYYRRKIDDLSAALQIPAERIGRALSSRHEIERFTAATLNNWLERAANAIPEVTQREWREAVRSHPELLWREPNQVAQHIREIGGMLNIPPQQYFRSLASNPQMMRAISRGDAQRFIAEIAEGVPVKPEAVVRLLQTHPFVIQTPGAEGARRILALARSSGRTAQKEFSELFHHPERLLAPRD